MNNQLSFLSDYKQLERRKHRRVSNGQFATQEQAELDKMKHERDYYKHMYEIERRKIPSIVSLLHARDEEIRRLKKRNNGI